MAFTFCPSAWNTRVTHNSTHSSTPQIEKSLDDPGAEWLLSYLGFKSSSYTSGAGKVTISRDKWYALSTGKPHNISDDLNSCLFPRAVIELGVDETMDCYQLIESVKFDSLRFDGCVSFGYILPAKITSSVFRLLYSRKFTDCRLEKTQNYIETDSLAKELKIGLSRVLKIFHQMKLNMIPFLRFNLKKHKAVELLTHSRFVTICCSQAIESLLLRLRNIESLAKDLEMKKLLNQIRDQLLHESTSILITSLESKCTLLSLKMSGTLTIAMPILVSHFVSCSSDGLLHYMSLMDAITNVYIGIFVDSGDGSSDDDTSWVRLKNVATAFFIFTRMCCQVYMRNNKISETQLIAELEAYKGSRSTIGEVVLNIRSVWYEDLLNNQEQSLSSQLILDHIDKRLDAFKSNGTGRLSKTSINETVTDTDSDRNSSNLSQFESFISTNLPPDFFESLWGQLSFDIFDHNSDQMDIGSLSNR